MDHLERVQQEFSRQAQTFATAPEVTESALTQRMIDALGGGTIGRILDVACGPGIITAALAETAGTVVGIDVTPEMLQKARQRCSGLSRTNVDFVQGDAARLPFASGAFDAVFTRLSVHHFLKPADPVAEMVRVLRPGGAFVLADIVSSEDRHESELHNAIEILRDPSHVRMLPISALCSLLTGSGLAIEDHAVWDRTREFTEWLAIANDPGRTAPLRTILATLAQHEETAGIGLRLDADTLFFFHRWALIRARKT